jgi:hypothetical protein
LEAPREGRFSRHYCAIPPSSGLFKRLQTDSAFVTLLGCLFCYGRDSGVIFSRQVAADELEKLLLGFTRAPGICVPRKKPRLCKPCLRYELSPSSQERQAALPEKYHQAKHTHPQVIVKAPAKNRPMWPVVYSRTQNAERVLFGETHKGVLPTPPPPNLHLPSSGARLASGAKGSYRKSNANPRG